MLQYIASVLCVGLALSMFRIKTEYKIGILLLIFQLFSFMKIPFIGRANFLIPICFLISELRNFRKIKVCIKNTVISRVMVLFLVSILLLIVFSPHLHDISAIRFVLQEEVLIKYFLIIYGFYACRNINQFKKVIDLSLIGLGIMTFFGVFNYVTKSSYYVGALMGGYNTSSMFDGGMNFSAMFADSSRFRVNSTFLNPFDYGFMCVVLALLYSYAYQLKILKTKVYYIALVSCVFGIVTCGSRTVLLVSMIAWLVYVYCAFNLDKKIKLLFVVFFVSVIAYISIPAVAEKVDFAMSAFDNNSDVGGSNVEGRSAQYAAVFYHIQDNLLFGKGYMYFTIDLGWGKGKEYIVDSDLFGLEGVAMNYLLERGFVGYILYLLFYIILFLYLIRNRRKGKHEYALAVSVLAAYFAYANMTGELLSVQPTLLILGCAIGILYSNKNKNKLCCQKYQSLSLLSK